MALKKENFREIGSVQPESPFETGCQDLEVVIEHIRKGKPLSLEVIRFIPHYLTCDSCRNQVNKAVEKTRSGKTSL